MRSRPGGRRNPPPNLGAGRLSPGRVRTRHLATSGPPSGTPQNSALAATAFLVSCYCEKWANVVHGASRKPRSSEARIHHFYEPYGTIMFAESAREQSRWRHWWCPLAGPKSSIIRNTRTQRQWDGSSSEAPGQPSFDRTSPGARATSAAHSRVSVDFEASLADQPMAPRQQSTEPGVSHLAYRMMVAFKPLESRLILPIF